LRAGLKLTFSARKSFLLKVEVVVLRIPVKPCSLSVVLTISRDSLRASSNNVAVDEKNTAGRRVREVGRENFETRLRKEDIFMNYGQFFF